MNGEADTTRWDASTPVTVDLRLSVNRDEHPITVDTRETLLDTLRERLDLIGAKKGCDHGQCGGCRPRLRRGGRAWSPRMCAPRRVSTTRSANG
ncbi:2Fe-2S iron-sulfur cluster-binding protein [Streptosporangium canum]|uniref:2Fe-2S iron-sulfur cluster-binding protein n=1 Tax=Streptosporangium canum TaxID=324952 RepID=UPI003F4B119F